MNIIGKEEEYLGKLNYFIKKITTDRVLLQGISDHLSGIPGNMSRSKA
jgi:hypothetical protein